MNEIERAIKYAEVRNICAGKFSFACGYEKCDYYNTGFCISEIPPFMRESEFNSIALQALCEKQEREAEPCEYCEDTTLPRRGGAHDFRVIGKELYFYDSQCGWEGEAINYCPYCGRKLTSPEPKESEDKADV